MADSKYYAFISYNHKDEKIARWLHTQLEKFKLPSAVCNDLNAEQRYLRPIFRDRDELNAGILGDELKNKLEASKFLIVICTENSANSAWVSNEVKAFIGMGRLKRIIPLMAEEGLDTLPAALREYTAEHPDQELLGVSIPEIGKEKALIRVISKMLEVEFDSLWDRHKRQKRRKILGVVALFTFVISSFAAIWYKNQPRDVCVSVSEVSEYNVSLPPISNVIVEMVLDNEVKVDTIATLEEKIFFRNIPAEFMGEIVKFRIYAAHCIPVDTAFALGAMVDLKLLRDTLVYGHVSARLFDFDDEKPLPGKHINIAGTIVETDDDGCFCLDVPLKNQSTKYEITGVDVDLIDTEIYMPCQTLAIISAK